MISIIQNMILLFCLDSQYMEGSQSYMDNLGMFFVTYLQII